VCIWALYDSKCRLNKDYPCEIWGFHGGDYDDVLAPFRGLECDMN
jgi:hypothetical protein